MRMNNFIFLPGLLFSGSSFFFCSFGCFMFFDGSSDSFVSSGFSLGLFFLSQAGFLLGLLSGLFSGFGSFFFLGGFGSSSSGGILLLFFVEFFIGLLFGDVSLVFFSVGFVLLSLGFPSVGAFLDSQVQDSFGFLESG